MTAPGNGCITAVLWDMDGVLVDTEDFHYHSWCFALKEAGIPFDRETFRTTFGMNNAGVLETLLGRLPETVLLEKISDCKEKWFRSMIHGQATALPGVRLWLERLSRKGVRQAIASSAPMENIDLLVNELELRPYFSTLVSAFRLPGKPDPSVFLEAARRIGAPPGRCVVVEDAIAGVEAARRAGMRCIAVTNTNPGEVLSDADIVVDSLAELPLDAFELLWYPEHAGHRP